MDRKPLIQLGHSDSVPLTMTKSFLYISYAKRISGGSCHNIVVPLIYFLVNFATLRLTLIDLVLDPPLENSTSPHRDCSIVDLATEKS